MLTCINYKQKPSTMFQNCNQPLLFTFLKFKRDVAKPQKNVQTKLLDLQWMKPWNWKLGKEKKGNHNAAQLEKIISSTC
jgi:hypothetical protein